MARPAPAAQPYPDSDALHAEGGHRWPASIRRSCSSRSRSSKVKGELVPGRQHIASVAHPHMAPIRGVAVPVGDPHRARGEWRNGRSRAPAVMGQQRLHHIGDVHRLDRGHTPGSPRTAADQPVELGHHRLDHRRIQERLIPCTLITRRLATG